MSFLPIRHKSRSFWKREHTGEMLYKINIHKVLFSGRILNSWRLLSSLNVFVDLFFLLLDFGWLTLCLLSIGSLLICSLGCQFVVCFLLICYFPRDIFFIARCVLHFVYVFLSLCHVYFFDCCSMIIHVFF